MRELDALETIEDGTHILMESIAELEAENERLRGAYGILHQEWVRALLRAEQDEGPQ